MKTETDDTAHLPYTTLCECDRHVLVEQNDGHTLGFAPNPGVKFLEVDGKLFKDLARAVRLATVITKM